MTDSRDDEVILGVRTALLMDLIDKLDLGAGLRDIMEPTRRYEMLLQDIENKIALDAGLSEILPQSQEAVDERRRNTRRVNGPAGPKGSSSGARADALVLVEGALNDLGDVQLWAANPQEAPYGVDETMLEVACIHLRKLSRGIDDGSIGLKGALSEVRDAGRNINGFVVEGFPLIVGLTARRALEKLQQVEELLPRLFDSSGNTTRTLL